HAQVFNLFNEQAVIAVNSTVLTNNDRPSIAPFNPFTDTPKQGVNYRLGPNFGKPTSSAGYQPPRTFQFAVGLRFSTVAFACSGSAPQAHRRAARQHRLDRPPDPFAALRLPRRKAPPLGYFAETPRAATRP